MSIQDKLRQSDLSADTKVSLIFEDGEDVIHAWDGYEEEVEQIRKKNPKMDIFKSGEELKKEGKMRSVDPITSEEVIVDIPDHLKKDGPKKDKEPSFKERMSMLEGMAERGANRQFLRAGIQALANSPLVGGKAALEAAKNVGNLTALNMAAMADQNLVLSQNPTKQKIAGKYFG